MLIFVVNGEEVHVEAEPDATLASARDQALAQSKNTARGLEDWELRNHYGVLLVDPSNPISTYFFPSGARLFLTLKVGAGGTTDALDTTELAIMRACDRLAGLLRDPHPGLSSWQRFRTDAGRQLYALLQLKLRGDL